jgi:hypothetical protein
MQRLYQSVWADLQAGYRDLLFDRACVEGSAKLVGFMISDSRKCLNSAEIVFGMIGYQAARLMLDFQTCRVWGGFVELLLCC